MKYMTKLAREISKMDIEKAIQILKYHNQWRRCNDDSNMMVMVNPALLGKAIDLVVEYFESKNTKIECAKYTHYLNEKIPLRGITLEFHVCAIDRKEIINIVPSKCSNYKPIK